MVRISASAEGTKIVITVEDDGSGISEAAISEAFLPGVRLNETVPADGFGLTIANELVQLFGATISLKNEPPGGLRQSITMPRAIA